MQFLTSATDKIAMPENNLYLGWLLPPPHFSLFLLCAELRITWPADFIPGNISFKCTQTKPCSSPPHPFCEAGSYVFLHTEKIYPPDLPLWRPFPEVWKCLVYLLQLYLSLWLPSKTRESWRSDIGSPLQYFSLAKTGSVGISESCWMKIRLGMFSWAYVWLGSVLLPQQLGKLCVPLLLRAQIHNYWL